MCVDYLLLSHKIWDLTFNPSSNNVLTSGIIHNGFHHRNYDRNLSIIPTILSYFCSVSLSSSSSFFAVAYLLIHGLLYSMCMTEHFYDFWGKKWKKKILQKKFLCEEMMSFVGCIFLCPEKKRFLFKYPTACSEFAWCVDDWRFDPLVLSFNFISFMFYSFWFFFYLFSLNFFFS